MSRYNGCGKNLSGCLQQGHAQDWAMEKNSCTLFIGVKRTREICVVIYSGC